MNPSSLTIPSSELRDAERYRSALEFVFGRLNYERAPDRARTIEDFDLSRMKALLASLGDPQWQVPTVHIAGSKGKGSTATMIATILREAGCRTGLFTSPHPFRYEERFTVDGLTPSAAEVANLVDRLRPAVESMDLGKGTGPTFFEITTAIGWLHFLACQVDVAVIEVGLGGRLDSTNVCRPMVSVITSISRDHTRLLGETEEAIAGEKAGIIKPGVPVVSGVTAPGPAAVIEDIARERDAPLYVLDRDLFAISKPPGCPPYDEPPRYRMSLTSPLGCMDEVELGLPGLHQVRNAALAVVACQILADRRYPVHEAVIQRGLQRVACPLRTEVVARNPLVIVDAAHNPASIDALCRTLQSVHARRRIAIFAASRDKEADVMLSVLNASFDEVILTSYSNNVRSLGCDELEPMARSRLTIPWRRVIRPAEALVQARSQATPDDLICVTGSFFLAAEARQLFDVACDSEIT